MQAFLLRQQSPGTHFEDDTIERALTQQPPETDFEDNTIDRALTQQSPETNFEDDTIERALTQQALTQRSPNNEHRPGRHFRRRKYSRVKTRFPSELGSRARSFSVNL